ncbi:MAG: hypothetical protein H2212_03425 [Ruminococcus sp.]|nr:hypothetical protein [Ruminococcus sp.]
MKNAVISFFLIVILIFGIVIINTVESKTTRSNELNNNLDKAMRNSMEVLLSDNKYPAGEQGVDEFIADFIQNFLVNTTSDAQFEIDVKAADIEKGLLDVEVTGYYNQVIGTGKVTSRKIAVLEDYDNMENVYYTVTFYLYDPEKDESKPIKQVNVHNKDFLAGDILPQNLALQEGQSLNGWKLKDSEVLYNETNINELSITEDLEFTADISISEQEDGA